eukprot:TRINITY_DN9293_c0_g1_i1.p1 TRINITY_DN9293_c0_g1~~TRINITY_DN9293_c0_g1_i1.p1  ORF type:complete len:125 (+),score=18.38 TRINITY_DN9293_c0_g1_i1:126-500(+)
MENPESIRQPDSNDILVHSFQLDASTDFCSLPICWPNKQAMLHPPRNFSAHLTNFLPYQDGVKMLEEINTILRDTAFPNGPCNLLMLICIISASHLMLSYVVYFSLMYYKKVKESDLSAIFKLE